MKSFKLETRAEKKARGSFIKDFFTIHKPNGKIDWLQVIILTGFGIGILVQLVIAILKEL